MKSHLSITIIFNLSFETVKIISSGHKQNLFAHLAQSWLINWHGKQVFYFLSQVNLASSLIQFLHILLYYLKFSECMTVKKKKRILNFYLCYLSSCLVAQSCLTLCKVMDGSPPGSSVHGILQARILEWVAIPFFMVSSLPRDQTLVTCIAGRLFTL